MHRPVQNATSSLIGKTAWSSFASLSTTLASAVTVVIMARVLGVAGAGRFAYGTWIAGTAGQIALFALPQVAMRFLSVASDRPGVTRWVASRGMALAIPGAVAAGAAIQVSGEALPTVIATGLLALAAMASAMGQAILVGNQDYRRLAVLSAATAVLQVAATTTGAVVAGPAGGLAGSAAAQLPLALGLLASRNDTTGALPPGALRRVRSYALHSWVAATLSLVAWSRLEFVFLQARGPEAVALYAVALTVSQLALQPLTLLGGALLPHFGELVGGNHTEASRETFAAVTRGLAVLAFPLCLGLAAVAPTLVPVVFGRPFAGASGVASVLVAGTSLVGIAPGVTAFVYSHERVRFVSSAALVSAVLAAVAFWLAIPAFGLFGAAAVRVAVQGAGVLAGFWYAARRLGARPPVSRVIRAALAALVAAAAGGIVASLGQPNWASVLGGIGTVIVAFALAAPLFRPLEPRDVAAMNVVLCRRIPPPIRPAVERYLWALAGAARRVSA